MVCFLMSRRPPRSTRTDTLFPSTTLVRSSEAARHVASFLSGEPGPNPRPDLPAFAALKLATEDLKAYYMEALRSEEHTSELQSLMRISYAVFCLKKKTNNEQ